MEKEEYIHLYEKYISGETLTPEEKSRLDLYRDDFKWEDGPWSPALGNHDQIETRILNKLKSSIGKQPVKRFPLKLKLAAAATVLMACAVGLLLWRNGSHKQPAIAKKQSYYHNDVLPGGNKATLTLANGSKIILDKTQNGTVIKQGFSTVNKTRNGQLVYVAPQVSGALNASLAYNTISTPKGGQYQVVLPDGTKVWLNATSSLKFPTEFTGKERNVELTGEGYFEVAKNAAMPFKVNVNNVVVEVLGTHFDVMAYDNEPAIKTALLEGSVKVKNNNKQALIVPGEQALAYKNNSIKVEQADLEEAVAWKNGYFMFHNENIQNIMKKVARWYDVDVEYRVNLQGKEFGGSVSRFKNISELLKTLELTGTIHFKIEGRKVIVME